MDARRPMKPIISDPLIIPRVKQVKFKCFFFQTSENTNQFCVGFPLSIEYG